MSWKRPNAEIRMLPLLSSIRMTENDSGYWIDIGTGDGLFAKLINSKFPNSYVIQTDISYFTKIFPGVNCSITHIPVRSSSISGIICGQVLHYIPHSLQKKVIYQLLKCLEQNGELLIVEYEGARPTSWLPYPISTKDMIEISNNLDYKITRINDGNRPKFGFLIKK